MGAKLTFQIASKLEEAGFKDAAAHLTKMDEIQGKAAKSAGAFSEAAGDLKAELLGVASVVGVIAFFKSCADESSRAEQTEALLAARVDSTGISYQKVKPQIDAFTRALAEQTRFSNGQAQDALGLMIDKTQDVGKAQKLLVDAMGLSISRHIDLATAGELLAGVSEHNTRAQSTLAKMMGMTTKEAKDSDAILREVHKRFGDLAMSEDTFESKQKKLTNAWSDFKETVGNGVLPVLAKVFDWMSKFIKSIPVWIGQLAAVFTSLANDVAFTMERMFLYSTFQFKKAEAKLKEHTAAQIAIQKEFDSETLKMAEIWGEKKKEIDQKNIVDGLARHKDMLDQTRTLIAQYNAQGVLDQQASIEARITALRMEQITKEQLLREQLGAEKESEANIQKAILASRAATEREILKIKMEGNKVWQDVTKTTLQGIGAATEKFVQGDKNAWRDLAKSTISLIAQEAEAVIAARAAEGAFAEIAKFGAAGIPAAGAILAMGAVQIAAIGALAGGAGALIGGGAGASAGASGGGGGGGSLGSGVSAPAPADSGRGGMSLTIVIDQMVGDASYVDSLVQKISDRVERNDMRLVATTVKS